MAWITSSPPTPRIEAPRICFVSRVDQDLHEALRLALLDGAARRLVMAHVADQRRLAGLRTSASVMPARPSGGSM